MIRRFSQYCSSSPRRSGRSFSAPRLIAGYLPGKKKLTRHPSRSLREGGEADAAKTAGDGPDPGGGGGGGGGRGRGAKGAIKRRAAMVRDAGTHRNAVNAAYPAATSAPRRCGRRSMPANSWSPTVSPIPTMAYQGYGGGLDPDKARRACIASSPRISQPISPRSSMCPSRLDWRGRLQRARRLRGAV